MAPAPPEIITPLYLLPSSPHIASSASVTAKPAPTTDSGSAEEDGERYDVPADGAHSVSSPTETQDSQSIKEPAAGECSLPEETERHSSGDSYGSHVDDRLFDRNDKGGVWTVSFGANAASLTSDESADPAVSEGSFPGSWDPGTNTPLPLPEPPVISFDYGNSSRRHHMPLSLALSVSRTISGPLALETGITYSYLRTTFETPHARSTARWHYLGIPIRLNASFLKTGRVSLYGSAGIRADIPLYSETRLDYHDGSPDLWE